MAGEDAQDRAVYALRTLYVEMPLRTQHAGAFAGQLQGLLGGSGAEQKELTPHGRKIEYSHKKSKTQGDAPMSLS